MDDQQRRRETVAAFFERYADAVGDPVIRRGAEAIRRSYPGRTPKPGDVEAVAELRNLLKAGPKHPFTTACYVARSHFSPLTRAVEKSIAKRLLRKARKN